MPLSPAPKGYPIKLVRDRTPEIINFSGEPGDLFYAPFDGKDSERYAWLRKKLLEEVGEFLIDGGLSELADVVVVIEAIAALQGTTIEALGVHGRGDRGGFTQAVMMYGRHPEYDR